MSRFAAGEINQIREQQDYGRSSGAPSVEDQLASDVDPPSSCVYWRWRRTLLLQLHLLAANPGPSAPADFWMGGKWRRSDWGLGASGGGRGAADLLQPTDGGSTGGGGTTAGGGLFAARPRVARDAESPTETGLGGGRVASGLGWRAGGRVPSADLFFFPFVINTTL
ncbi:hypothetical protein SORBI_3003G234300 [Sorghum bicolor]|uniref:Uncharacterized protein n=1 Tax=Sorghum bicolor TaxID=4558 RepID=C5XEK3_SORBI|nr:hypothetical protein SORBI_3003G234300 [Sorghum bicolor]